MLLSFSSFADTVIIQSQGVTDAKAAQQMSYQLNSYQKYGYSNPSSTTYSSNGVIYKESVLKSK